MAVDPTDPDTFEADAEETEEFDVEAPEADAAEQHADLVPERDSEPGERSLESANPADAAEQARVVGLHEDDYR
ncbi:hypothetical protein AB0C51_08135 [Streptomyces pathocidini]|uniref:Uncharacterized protein n=1 Tax=Streptomyces pathocidini TaxID=1650571 RepID=A0ABW7URC7_9ACTN|nr:hypothetical protein [Streptomyces pathocidini]